MFSRADQLYSPSHASRADEPGGLRVALIPRRAADSSSMVQGGADMAKAVLAGMLVLGLAACTGGAAKVARDGVPPEQLLGGGTRVSATIQDSLSSRTKETGDTLHAPEERLSLVVSSVTVNGEQYPVSADLDPVPHHLQVRTASTDRDPGGRSVRRDVVVSAGTPIVFALTNSLKVSAR